jgi:Flp pilus assembly protein TadB
LLAAASGALVAAVAEDSAVAWLGGLVSLILVGAATWMAYAAEMDRKRRLSSEERAEEFNDEQW